MGTPLGAAVRGTLAFEWSTQGHVLHAQVDENATGLVGMHVGMGSEMCVRSYSDLNRSRPAIADQGAIVGPCEFFFGGGGDFHKSGVCVQQLHSSPAVDSS